MKKILKLIFIPVFIIYFIIIKLPYKDIKIETKNKYNFTENKYGNFLSEKFAGKNNDYQTIKKFHKKNNDLKTYLLTTDPEKYDLNLIKNLSTQTLKKDSKDITATLSLFKYYFYKKDYKTSLNYLKKIDDKNFTTILLYSWNLLALKQYTKALDYLENQLENKRYEKYRKYILMHLGFIAELANENIFAGECYDEVFESEKPDIYDVEKIMAFYIKQKNNKKALEIIENYYKQTPLSLSCINLYESYKQKTYIPTGIKDINTGIAKAILDTANINFPIYNEKNYTDFLTTLSFINYFDKTFYMADLITAEVYEKLNNQEMFNNFLNRVPQNYYLFQLLEHIKIDYVIKNENTRKQGINEYKKLLTKYNKNPVFFYIFANFMAEDKDFTEAIKNYTTSLLLTNNDIFKSKILYKRGISYYEKGDYNKGLDDFNTALQLKNNDYEFLSYYSNILINKNINLDKGIDLIEKALNQNPINSTLWNNLGQAFYKKNDFKSALSMFELAKNIDPTNPIITNNLGDCYNKLKRTREAIFEWQKVVKILETHPIKDLNINELNLKINTVENSL